MRKWLIPVIVLISLILSPWGIDQFFVLMGKWWSENQCKNGRLVKYDSKEWAKYINIVDETFKKQGELSINDMDHIRARIKIERISSRVFPGFPFQTATFIRDYLVKIDKRQHVVAEYSHYSYSPFGPIYETLFVYGPYSGKSPCPSRGATDLFKYFL